VALDTTIIKADNLLATGPTTTNTAVPSKVTQVTGQNVWEYEFSNTWPQVGTWTIALNADGFSIPKGTILGSFLVTQGTVYKLAVNWETTENVQTIANRVASLESGATALTASVTAAQDTAVALGTRVSAAETAQTTASTTIANHTTQIAALTTRIDELEVQIVLLTP